MQEVAQIPKIKVNDTWKDYQTLRVVRKLVESGLDHPDDLEQLRRQLRTKWGREEYQLLMAVYRNT